MRHQPSRTAKLLTLLALLGALLVAATPTTPVAAAAPASGAARALAREQRVHEREQRKQQREAERQSRRQAREARRAARATQRADGGEGATQDEGETHGGETQTPHASTPRRTCTVAATATPTPAATGEAVTLAGTLTCPTADEAGEQTVTVYAHERGSGAGSSTIAGTATTAADGSFQFHTAALTVTSAFTLRTATARHPAHVLVPVDAGVSLVGPLDSGATLPIGAARQAGGPARETFTGAIHPEQANRMVALEVRYGDGEWRKVAYARTDAEGRFSFSHRFKAAGEVSVIAVARPLGTEQAESIPLTYTVAQAQTAAGQDASAPVPPAVSPPSAAAPAS